MLHWSRALPSEVPEGAQGGEDIAPLLSLPQHLTQPLQSTAVLERLGFKYLLLNCPYI